MSLINQMLRDLDRRNAANRGEEGSVFKGVVPAGGLESMKRGLRAVWILSALVVALAGVVIYLALFAAPPAPSAPVPQPPAQRMAKPLPPPPPTAEVSEPMAGGAAAPISAETAEGPEGMPPVVATPVPAPATVAANTAAPAALPAKPMIAATAVTPAAAPSAPAVPSKPLPAQPLPTSPLEVGSEQPAPRAPARKKPASNEGAAPPPVPASPPPIAPDVAASQKGVLEKRQLPPTPEQSAELSYQRAYQSLQAGHSFEAERSLRDALRFSPSHLPARETLAGILTSANRLVEADALLKEGMVYHPRHLLFAKLRARVKAEQGDVAGAVELLEENLAKVTPDGDYLALLAALEQRAGRYPESADHYRSALKSNPGNAIWWLGLAISLEGVSDTEEAATAYRRALDAGLAKSMRDYAEKRLSAIEGRR